MAVPSEKAITAVGEPESPKSPTLDTPDHANNIGNSDNLHQEKPVQEMSNQQYPHGLPLILLAGSSIIAVFLIALDQVSTHSTHTYLGPKEQIPDTKGVYPRPSSAQQFPRSRTSSTALMTCHGMPQPTS